MLQFHLRLILAINIHVLCHAQTRVHHFATRCDGRSPTPRHASSRDPGGQELCESWHCLAQLPRVPATGGIGVIYVAGAGPRLVVSEGTGDMGGRRGYNWVTTSSGGWRAGTTSSSFGGDKGSGKLVLSYSCELGGAVNLQPTSDV